MTETQTFSVQLGAPFSAGKEARTVSVTPLGEGRFQVAVDGGPPEIIDARPVFSAPGKEPGKAVSTWSLLLADGRQRLCDVEGTAPDLKVAVSSGEPVALKLVDAREQALLSALAGPRPSGPTDVRAPMPGKVVKVLCQVGQRVAAGQGLLIIEAMKMENELRAPGEGVVDKLGAVEGQTVEGGAIVVSLSAVAESGAQAPKGE